MNKEEILGRIDQMKHLLEQSKMFCSDLRYALDNAESRYQEIEKELLKLEADATDC